MSQATTKSTAPNIIITRTFDAPASLVFKTWTDSALLQQWYAPLPYTLPVSRMDLRPGGTWLYAMESPEGERHWAKSVYREITPPSRLVYVDSFSDENGATVPPESFVTVTFEESAGKTTVTILTEFENQEDRDTLANMGMVEGFNMGLDQLANLLETLQA
jgi:uncharacterized protein YndB with AHSA1/START domain